jgi:hypothetical protein
MEYIQGSGADSVLRKLTRKSEHAFSLAVDDLPMTVKMNRQSFCDLSFEEAGEL